MKIASIKIPKNNVFDYVFSVYTNYINKYTSEFQPIYEKIVPTDNQLSIINPYNNQRVDFEVFTFITTKMPEGWFDPNDFSIHISFPKYIPSSNEDFLEMVHLIKNTINHELRHLIQFSINQNAGLPKKLIRNYTNLEHDQKDVEYHPSMSEAIDSFNFYKNIFPKQKWPDLIKTIIALQTLTSYNNYIVFPTPFFKSLLNLNQNKWKLAVKQFVKEIL